MESWYDPEEPPPVEEWLAFTESERIDEVEMAHFELGERLPNPMLHASMHVTVENQLALDVYGVRGTLARLRREGLSRHDAIHAIAQVMVLQMQQIVQHKAVFDEQVYRQELDRMTAKRYLASVDE